MRARAAAIFFAEPCGLENTHNAVMRVRLLVVSTPKKRAQTRETYHKFERYAPAMAYFAILVSSPRGQSVRK